MAEPITPEATPATVPPATFSQEEVTRIAAKEAEKARKSMLKNLGMPEDMTDFATYKDGMEKYQQWQTSQKTGLENATTALATAQSRVTELEAQLAQSAAMMELTKANVNPEFADFVLFQAQKAGKTTAEYLTANPQYMKAADKTPPPFAAGSTQTPPPLTMTREQFGKLSYEKRVEMMNTNPDQYNSFIGGDMNG